MRGGTCESLCRHPGEGRDPDELKTRNEALFWTPASAGVTLWGLDGREHSPNQDRAA